MDAKFWYQVWEQGRLGFHQTRPNPQLVEFWPQVVAASHTHGRGPVLVPLAGKSKDMLWLREQGHTVVGVELSEIAVRDFFAENDLTAVSEPFGSFVRYRSQPAGLELWCGDFFDLTLEMVQEVGITAVYDRASLIALPPEMRPAYMQQMARILPAHTHILLLAIEYDQAEMSGPPFSVPDAEIRQNYSEAFHLTHLRQQNVLQKDRRLRHFLSSLTENVYLLERVAGE